MLSSHICLHCCPTCVPDLPSGSVSPSPARPTLCALTRGAALLPQAHSLCADLPFRCLGFVPAPPLTNSVTASLTLPICKVGVPDLRGS